jgi:capsular polysaccharide biosynthesis protein
VDVEEAVRRLRANLTIIAVAIVLGLSFPIATHLGGGAVYKASTRIVPDVRDPRDGGGADAIADTALGIVSSPGRVAAALEKVGASRNAEHFARNNITVEPIGSSALLQLSVTDHDRRVASDMANALGDELVSSENALAQSRLQTILADLDQRITVAVATVTALEPGFAAASGHGLSPAVERYREAVRQRDDLESERRRLIQNAAEKPEAAVVDPASPPFAAEPSGLRSDLVLGAILGLVIGLTCAAIRETIHPTIAGERALARAIGAPSIGRLSGKTSALDEDELSSVAARARLAVEAAGFRIVVLSGIGDSAVDLDALARRLQDALAGEERIAAAMSRPGGRSFVQVLAIDADGLRAMSASGVTVGLIFVAPPTLDKRELEWVNDLHSITGWKVLGVVTYRSRKRRFGPRASTVRRTAGARAGSSERANLPEPPYEAPRPRVVDVRGPREAASVPESAGERAETRWGRSPEDAFRLGSRGGTPATGASDPLALDLTRGDRPAAVSTTQEDIAVGDGGVNGGSSEQSGTQR